MTRISRARERDRLLLFLSRAGSIPVKYVARVILLLLPLTAFAQSPVNKLWTELEEKRAKLPNVHQEFEYSVSFKTAYGEQAAKRMVIVDLSRGLWRESSVGGAGGRIRIFDGNDTFAMDEGGNEYTRATRKPKDPLPAPGPYNVGDVDWRQAKEILRQSCGRFVIE